MSARAANEEYSDLSSSDSDDSDSSSSSSHASRETPPRNSMAAGAPPTKKRRTESAIKPKPGLAKGIDFVVGIKRLECKQPKILAKEDKDQVVEIFSHFGIILSLKHTHHWLDAFPTILAITPNSHAFYDGRLLANSDEILSVNGLAWKMGSNFKNFVKTNVPKVLRLRVRRPFALFKSPSSVFTSELGKEMLGDATFSDFVFNVGGEVIHVHKLAVCAKSPVVRAMLTSDMREKQANRAEVHDVDPFIFKAMIRYIYTGAVISEEHEKSPSAFPDFTYFLELIRLGDFYQVAGIEELCERGIDVALTTSNALNILKAIDGRSVPCQKIRQKILRFMAVWSERVIESPSWRTMERHPLILKDFCASLSEAKIRAADADKS